MQTNNPDQPFEDDIQEMRAEFERNSILDAEEEKAYKAEKSQENKKPDYLSDLVTKIGTSGNKANKIIGNWLSEQGFIDSPKGEDDDAS